MNAKRLTAGQEQRKKMYRISVKGIEIRAFTAGAEEGNDASRGIQSGIEGGMPSPMPVLPGFSHLTPLWLDKPVIAVLAPVYYINILGRGIGENQEILVQQVHLHHRFFHRHRLDGKCL